MSRSWLKSKNYFLISNKNLKFKNKQKILVMKGKIIRIMIYDRIYSDVEYNFDSLLA